MWLLIAAFLEEGILGSVIRSGGQTQGPFLPFYTNSELALPKPSTRMGAFGTLRWPFPGAPKLGTGSELQRDPRARSRGGFRGGGCVASGAGLIASRPPQRKRLPPNPASGPAASTLDSARAGRRRDGPAGGAPGHSLRSAGSGEGESSSAATRTRGFRSIVRSSPPCDGNVQGPRAEGGSGQGRRLRPRGPGRPATVAPVRRRGGRRGGREGQATPLHGVTCARRPIPIGSRAGPRPLLGRVQVSPRPPRAGWWSGAAERSWACALEGLSWVQRFRDSLPCPMDCPGKLGPQLCLKHCPCRSN